MKKILAISGSLRKKSTNSILLDELTKLQFSDIEITIYDKIGEFPFFNPDLDDRSIAIIKDFAKQIQDADVILISSPEYVHAIPGVLKNALDWLVGTVVLERKKVGLIFASSTDAQYARESLVEILRTMSADITSEGILNLPGIKSSFNEQGYLEDSKILSELKQFVQKIAL